MTDYSKINIYAVGDDNFDIEMAEPILILDPLKDVYNVSVSQTINGDFRLSFAVPLKDDLSILDKIKTNNIISCSMTSNQPNETEEFRIANVTVTNGESRYAEIDASHIFLEIRKAIVVSVDEMIGSPVSTVLYTLWDNAKSQGGVISKFGLTFSVDNDIADFQIDFPKKEKTDLYTCIKDVIDTLGFGELEVHNTSVSFVRKIEGGNFGSVKIGLNASSIKTSLDISSIITRVYPFGKDNLDITQITSSGYIDSPNVSQYGVRAAVYEFSDISDPATLLSRSQWLFDEQNPERIDVPAVSVDAQIILLPEDRKYYKLGGEVNVSGLNLVDNPQRIVSLAYDPYATKEYKITLGRIQTDLWQYLKRVDGTSREITNKVKSKVNEVVRTDIVEVTREEVLAADVIEASAAFSEDLFVERLTTNLKSFKCIPNLILDGVNPKWLDDNNHTYSCANHSTVRGDIEMEGISFKFKEYRLVMADDFDNMTINDISPLVIGGKQVYYTSILGGKNPYEFFTFTKPKDKYPDITNENAEMFKVYMRKSEGEYVKAEFEFTLGTNADGTQTYNIREILGAGDEEGKGRFYLYKDTNGGMVSYISRTDNLPRGIHISDSAVSLLRGLETIPLLPIHIVDSAPAEGDRIEGDLYFVKGAAQ